MLLNGKLHRSHQHIQDPGQDAAEQSQGDVTTDSGLLPQQLIRRADGKEQRPSLGRVDGLELVEFGGEDLGHG